MLAKPFTQRNKSWTRKNLPQRRRERRGRNSKNEALKKNPLPI